MKSFTTDFSNSCGTGSTSYPEGVIRTMKFSAANDLIELKSFVPGQAALNTFYRALESRLHHFPYKRL